VGVVAGGWEMVGNCPWNSGASGCGGGRARVRPRRAAKAINREGAEGPRELPQWARQPTWPEHLRDSKSRRPVGGLALGGRAPFATGDFF